jgi:hypothetical protein
MYFVDECRVGVSSELGGRGNGKRFNAEFAESAEEAEKRKIG